MTKILPTIDGIASQVERSGIIAVRVFYALQNWAAICSSVRANPSDALAKWLESILPKTNSLPHQTWWLDSFPFLLSLAVHFFQIFLWVFVLASVIWGTLAWQNLKKIITAWAPLSLLRYWCLHTTMAHLKCLTFSTQNLQQIYSETYPFSFLPFSKILGKNKYISFANPAMICLCVFCGEVHSAVGHLKFIAWGPWGEKGHRLEYGMMGWENDNV